LEAHSLSPASGPASVVRRCAPRGSSSRRQRGGPTGQERSYAGTAQYPCAEHRGGIPRAAPSATPSKPGPWARVHLLCPEGPYTVALGDGLSPIRKPCRSVTSLPGPGPSSCTPTRPHAGRGWTVATVPACGRAVDAIGSGLRGTSPRGRVKSGRDRRASVPRHVEGAVTAVVTAHGVKRFRPAGPGGARGPTRREGPAQRGRPDNAIPFT
jgi:hypothetical protein